MKVDMKRTDRPPALERVKEGLPIDFFRSKD